MGTKNNPGAFDCYANAEPDEPMFVLLGRDMHAGGLVRLWAILRSSIGEDEGKVKEALVCAQAMDDYILAKKGLDTDATNGPFEWLYLEATKGIDEHPEDFDRSCRCDLCLSYGQ